MGLGRCVRGSEGVSHSLGIGIAYEEPERRGRGSGTAGGHTGNGQGPRAPALASEGRGGAQGPAPSVPTPGRLRWGVCSPRSPGAPTPRPALRIPWASLTGRAGAANRTLSPLPGPGGGGRQARSGQELRWWPKLPGGSDGSHVGDGGGGKEATLRSRIGVWAGPDRASDAGTNPGLYCNVGGFQRLECASGVQG